MGSLLEWQAVKPEESAANQLVEAEVGLFVGKTKGSQMGVGAVVVSALGTFTGVMLVTLEWWLEWQ